MKFKYVKKKKIVIFKLPVKFVTYIILPQLESHE